MRRLAVIALVCAAIGAQADTIFDTFTGVPGITTTGSSPRNLLADTFTPIASGSGQWKLQTISAGFFVFAGTAPGTLTSVSAEYTFWNTVTTSTTSTDPEFSNQAGQFTIGFGDVAQTTSNQAFTFGPVDISALNIVLNGNSEKGVGVRYFINGQIAGGVITMALADYAPVVGSATNGFFRDANDDGIIQVGEARVFTGLNNTNVVMQLTGIDPVPEPASMAVLGLGLAMIARRRRRA